MGMWVFFKVIEEQGYCMIAAGHGRVINLPRRKIIMTIYSFPLFYIHYLGHSFIFAL